MKSSYRHSPSGRNIIPVATIHKWNIKGCIDKKKPKGINQIRNWFKYEVKVNKYFTSYSPGSTNPPCPEAFKLSPNNFQQIDKLQFATMLWFSLCKYDASTDNFLPSGYKE
jgi:hypothetical protein